MYRVFVEHKFDAAHRIAGYKGMCKNLHGHTWRVVVCCKCSLDKNNIAIDMKLLKSKIMEVVDKFDHTNLNKVLKEPNVTCEYLAYYIFNALKEKKLPVESVVVKEGDGGWAEYSLL